MAVKTHVVQNTFELGQVDELYSQRDDIGARTRAAKTMKNWVPTIAGTPIRRWSTERLSAWTDLESDGVLSIPFRVAGRTDIIIFAIDDGTGGTSIRRVNTDTGVISNVKEIDTETEVPLLLQGFIQSYVQAGDSLFFTTQPLPGGADEQYRVNRFIYRESDDEIFLDQNAAGERQFQFYRQLNGLWTWVASAQFQSLRTSGAVLVPDEQLSGVASEESIILIGDEEEDFDTGTLITVTTTNDTWEMTIQNGTYGGAAFANSKLYVRMFNGTGTDDFINGALNARAVGFYQQRLALGNISFFRTFAAPPFNRVERHPMRLLLSESADIFKVIPALPLNDDSAIDANVFIQNNRQIEYLMTVADSLLAFTDTGVIANSGQLLGSIPPNYQSVHNRGIGLTTVSEDVYSFELPIFPVQDDSQILYVPRNSGAVYAIEFDDNTKAFSAFNVSSLVSEAFGDKDIKQIAIAQTTKADPTKRAFVVFTDGTVAVGSEVLDQFVTWTFMEMAEDLKVESIVSLAGELYLLVRRTTDGELAVFQFERDLTLTSFPDFVYDVKSTLTAAQTDSWTTTESFFFGRDDVFVVVNGVSYGYVSVDGGGNFTTPVEGTEVEFGVVFDSQMVLYSQVIADEQGSSQNRLSNNVRNIARLKDTKQIRLNDEAALSTVPPTPGGPFIEKEFTVRHNLGWEREHELEITNQDAYNAHVLSVSREFVV